jgi:hypothetical protein
MKPHEINKLNNFISGFYIDQKICKKLINVYEKNKDIAEAGVTHNGKTKVVNKKCKLSTDLCLTPNPTYDFYFKELQKCLDQYIKQYSQVNDLSRFRIVEDCNIQKYKKNEGFFNWHFERGSLHNSSRILVWMTYLNTVSDGGETEFLYQKLKVKPEAGLTLIWPSEWTHTHKGITSKTQTKYIITGWYNLINEDQTV